MFYEALTLEIHATKAGMDVIKPSWVVGTSGVSHRFSFLALRDAKLSGFDFYQKVTEIEVLRTYTKKLDANVEVAIVCLAGKPTEGGLMLAEAYGMPVLTPAEIDVYFERELVEVRVQAQ